MDRPVLLRYIDLHFAQLVIFQSLDAESIMHQKIEPSTFYKSAQACTLYVTRCQNIITIYVSFLFHICDIAHILSRLKSDSLYLGLYCPKYFLPVTFLVILYSSALSIIILMSVCVSACVCVCVHDNSKWFNPLET